MIDPSIILTLVGLSVFTWTFIWDRLLVKAGFSGKAYWRRFTLIMAPFWLNPLIALLWFFSALTLGEKLSIGALVLLCGLLVASALMPLVGFLMTVFVTWPVTLELQQIRQTYKIPTPKPKPVGIFGLPMNFLLWLKRKLF